MPIYLESTLVAVGMYERLGFKMVDRFEMKIPRRGGDGDDLTDLYQEVCMVWWPNGSEGCGRADRT
jgi:ribosomal protein S18 acetylase RimI-like enzyme